jgi:hypothetical protein
MPIPTPIHASQPRCHARPRRLTVTRLAALIAASAALSAFAQTATIYGALGNFDVVNNTGQDACGFEVELEGVPSSAYGGAFTTQRYGFPTVTAYTAGAVSGTRVRYESLDCSLNKTVAHPPATGFAGSCYQWNTATYANAGCEHFGVYHYGSVSKISGRWLVADPARPGVNIPHDPPSAIASPYYYVQPAVVANADPIIVDVVEAPEPPEAPDRFGNAQWMKVFVRQMPREVTLDELLTDNPLVVPMDATLLESDWQLIQADPPSGGAGGRNRGRHQGGSSLKPTTRSVVHRYEMYAYNGAVDPVTNEALCADILCKVASAGEIGDFISANMTAVNVQGDFINVTKSGTGGGNVDSADKRISCGSKCVSPYAAGTVMTLTAKANSGSTFAGWSGACTGTGTCTVTVNGAGAVGAVFNAQAPSGGGGGGGTTSSFQLKVSVSNSGTVTSNIGGINCGTVCQATYPAGTAVTLTATPPAGKTFASWSGACTGTAPSCTVTVNGSVSAKATFNR